MNQTDAIDGTGHGREESRFYPGFDLLRVVAAGMVVFSHAFLIADTVEDHEPFQMVTGEIAGVYGVYLFFILSGFLVTDSALRSRTVAQFAVKRARRLLPAFVVANVVTVLGIGAVFSQSGVMAHLSDPAVWSALLRVLILQDSRLWMETVSFYAGQNEAQVWLSHSLNAVLWTIRIEIVCYVAVGVLLVLGGLRRNVSVALVVAASVYAFQYHWQIPGWGGLGFLFPSFAAGLALRLHIGAHVASGRVAVLCVIALCVAMVVLPDWHKIAPVLFPMFATYPLLWFGKNGWRLNAQAAAPFDPSYGMYIWGWPIQQMVLAGLYYLGWTGIGGPVFAMLSIPVVFVVGAMSWWLIESPFLRRARRPVATD